ncbi:hypothetical protein M422DRAFT_64146 [Sphaerobolus stellatus SS14]|nr:hypothetical protein M422DRAFT_64146 [Sphaerobolus stellatus SS14]
MVAIYSTKPDFTPKEAGAHIFSTKDLLELPAPEAGIANPAGDLIFIAVNSYKFENKKGAKRIYVMPLQKDAYPLSHDVPYLEEGEAFWIDSRTIGHVTTGSDKKQKLSAVTVLVDQAPTQRKVALSSALVGSFPTDGLANFKYNLEGEALVFSTNAWPEMDLTTAKLQDDEYETRDGTALVYDDPFVRHWDIQIGPKRPTLFSATLRRHLNEWVLEGDYIAPLKGTGHETPVEPFGGPSSFDISATHIAYTAKDPELPVALHTRQNVYIVSLKGGEKPRQLTSGSQGATDSPVFGANGKFVAWTEMPVDKYESDRCQVILYDLEKNIRMSLTPTWDRSANRLAFSPDGTVLYISAREHTRAKVFKLPLPSSLQSLDPKSIPEPTLITQSYSAIGIQPLSNDRLLFTRTTISSPNDVYLLSNISTNPEVERITRFTEDSLKGKTLEQPDDFWFEGADGKQVHAFVLPPKGYRQLSKEEREGKKWPVLFLIHGGPQYAWWDDWDVRWNFNIFANQGYFVVAPNPTGSLSFGQEFTDRIHENYGTRPFEDFQRGWKAVKEQYPEIDGKNAIAAGHSWGGFAIHWIQGHPEYNFGFKAAICEAGMFDTRYFSLATEELYFLEWDLGGSIFTEKGKEMANKFNPANFIDNFFLPELIIHGSKDYRVPETEAFSVFNLLRAHGIDSRLVLFPDANHMVCDSPNLSGVNGYLLTLDRVGIPQCPFQEDCSQRILLLSKSIKYSIIVKRFYGDST